MYVLPSFQVWSNFAFLLTTVCPKCSECLRFSLHFLFSLGSVAKCAVDIPLPSPFKV